MCRLFGMHAGTTPAKATFWLLKAPDSLSVQSHREPDGAGIGVFRGHGTPLVTKQPMAAWQDRVFARAARELESTTFLAHVRYASTGAHTTVNTHPFEQDGRLFAHNGTFGGLEILDGRLAELGSRHLVLGQTDSERMFALITAEIRRHGGDVAAGIRAAVAWIAENLPVYSLNLIVTSGTEVWALRYPATHELYVLPRPAGGHTRGAHLEGKSHRIQVHSQALAERPAVIIATERMDPDPGWRLMEPGELLHIDPQLRVHSSYPVGATPAHPLTLADLDPVAAASQHPETVR
ncbi:MAG: class II glutamine amidotransferase [Actinomycetota bacterium]|nr:class II glutamine amidotransferase [Actinomycetota bacterium]